MEFRNESRQVGSFNRGREQHGLTTSTPATVPLNTPVSGGPPVGGNVASGTGYSTGGPGTNVPITTTSTSGERITPQQGQPTGTTYQEGLKTLQSVKDFGSVALNNTWNYLFPEGKAMDPLAYLSLKVDETKNLISNLSNIPMNSYHSLFCAAAVNVCEKTELLKAWSIDHKVDRCRWDNKCDKTKFLFKDREWTIAVQRFIDLKYKISMCYEDCFDEAIRDYAFATRKLDRARERVIEYEKFKEKVEPVFYCSTRCQLVCKRKTAEKKFVCAKIKVEELRHRILHLHQDALDVCLEALDFLNNRVPDLENCSKNIGDDPDIRNCFDNLFRQYNENRDLLNDCVKCCRGKIAEFSEKRDTESWIGTRKIFGTGVNQPAGTQ